MEIIIDRNVSGGSADLIIYQPDAVVELTENTTLKVTSGKVYICAKRIILRGEITSSQGEIFLKGKVSIHNPDQDTSLFLMGPNIVLPQALAEISEPMISKNLEKKIKIINNTVVV